MVAAQKGAYSPFIPLSMTLTVDTALFLVKACGYTHLTGSNRKISRERTMSSGRWYRNELTGLPESVDANQQDVRHGLRMGCDIFCVRSFAAAAGYRSPRYFVAKVLTAPGSLLHAVPIHDTDGQIVTWGTRTESAVAGGESARASANAARGYDALRFDVSGGTSAITMLRTFVAKN